MSDTVFKKVDYDLGSLIKFIRLGEIGLPDIQRPFVWKNAKVRDLFDSMYRGYPVGYLLFWQNPFAATSRGIGTDTKQKSPSLVIVDGQQRLTSLYAVIGNIPVVRDNFESEHIQIAFNPIEETFEVVDAAILRDKSYLPSISVLWDSKTDLFEVVEGYLEGLALSRTVDAEESKGIKKAISKLQGLLSFPLTALELASDIDEEKVSDIFVRINSKGTPLKQADFILTLMSVFWDEGRTDLEQFCRAARTPSKGKSPYNHLVEPSPDQMLRVSIGVAFKRARLKHVYSILRGKDLETGQFSDERREQQFTLLKEAQSRALNLQYWHDFLKGIQRAGFRSGKMISSENNLLFSYMLYLIARTEYNVPEHELRNVIARWFFMSAVTGRFTGSPESAMEFDLAGLRDVDSPAGFVKFLDDICANILTKDFWAVTLPSNLATSSSNSPSLFAYHAALVLLDAKALFSDLKVAALLDPAVHANRSAVERHHLFPKAYLGKQGVSAIRDTNQIANYALVEWGDNSSISKQAPAEYLPKMKARLSAPELKRQYRWHALPSNWEHMDYREFLETRRELIAQVIADGYETLTTGISTATSTPEVVEDLPRILSGGESALVEFKSTLRTNLHTGLQDSKMEYAVLKTVAGFVNTNGGTLVIGAADDGSPVGIEVDKFENEDKMNLHLVNIVKARMGATAMTSIHSHFEDCEEMRVMVIRCGKSPEPVFLKEGEVERFYIRTGPSTSELPASQVQGYIRNRFAR